jgi:hypothetical protein
LEHPLSSEALRVELRKLMLEEIESLEQRTFGGASEKAFLEEQERLKRIREVSADFIAAVKSERT